MIVLDKIAAVTGKKWKITAIVISAISYAFVIPLFIEFPNCQIFILSTVPVLTVAWMLGISGAFITSAVVTLIHILLILIKGESLVKWVFVDGGGLGTLALLLSGSLVGRISLLRRRLAGQRELLLQTQEVTIFALAYEAELRDQATGKHLERTS